jgi:hypothetical protein
MQKAFGVKYEISNIRIDEDNLARLVIVRRSPQWLAAVLAGFGLMALGVAFFFMSKAQFLPIAVGFFLILSGLFSLRTIPYFVKLTFDFGLKQMFYTAKYFIRTPWKVEFDSMLGHILEVKAYPGNYNSNSVWLDLAGRERFILNFGGNAESAARVAARIEPYIWKDDPYRINPAEASPAAIVNSPSEPQPDYSAASTVSAMQHNLKSWATWMFVLGIIQMVSAGGFSEWGLLLILLGAISYVYKASPMFLVFTATMAWAGVSNLMDGSSLAWKGFAIVQFYWAFQTFREFRQFQKAEHAAEQTALTTDGKVPAPKKFKLAALLLGIGSVVFGLAGTLAFFINMVTSRIDMIYTIVDICVAIAVYSGLVAFALGLAGWLSAAKGKATAIIGCLAGALSLVMYITVTLILNSGWLNSPEPVVTGWNLIGPLFF